MRGEVFLAAAAFLAAGCVGDGGNANVAAPSTSVSLPIDYKVLPTVLDEVRTLEAPPKWRMGEWWRIKLTDAFTGQQIQVTRVVAGQEGENYLVGMPKDDWVNAFMVLHIPGFGEVRQLDLSYEVHDVRFEPLDFPLSAGKTWTTAFEGRPVTATVKAVSGTRADIWLHGGQDDINVTYDAEAGEIVKYDGVGYASYEVIEHGFDFEGTVTVPHMHDLIFVEFRVAGVLGGNLQPALPTSEVTVDATYDRVSFAIIIGTILPDASSPQGVYNEKATAPGGTVYQNQVLPTDAPGIKIFYYMHEKPGGKWTFEHVAGGPGVVGTEGIAYHVYDVVLPEGRLLPSTGEHPHGG